jgi:hypothetical protein
MTHIESPIVRNPSIQYRALEYGISEPLANEGIKVLTRFGLAEFIDGHRAGAAKVLEGAMVRHEALCGTRIIEAAWQKLLFRRCVVRAFHEEFYRDVLSSMSYMRLYSNLWASTVTAAINQELATSSKIEKPEIAMLDPERWKNRGPSVVSRLPNITRSLAIIGFTACAMHSQEQALANAHLSPARSAQIATRNN